jgi:hypothetical protein
VPRRSGAATRVDASPQGGADVADRPRDGFLETEAEREVRGDRRRERATRAMRRARRDPAALEDAERVALPEEVPDLAAGDVPSRHEDRAGPEVNNLSRREGGVVNGLSRGHPGELRRLAPVGSDERAEGEELPAEDAEPVPGQQGESSARCEDRVQHDVFCAVTPETRGNGPDVCGAVEHSDLHGGRSEVREDGVDLAGDEARGERFDGHDPMRVLRGTGDDDRGSPDAVGMEGEKVRLDTGAAAGVGPGDRNGRRSELLQTDSVAMATR